MKIANFILGYDADHVSNSAFILKLVGREFIFKNVNWDQPHSQLSVLNFENSN